MEEHCEAYFAWKQAGIQGAWCWHVDAHLDIGRDGLTPARLAQLKECQTLDEAHLRGLCGNAYVPWGGLHCGNYLYPAIREGIVDRLTWVIPPDIVSGNLLDWARGHLDGWFDLTLEEFDHLHQQHGVVQGTILGIPFQLGTADMLPLPDQPVLLDIDIDYFLNGEGHVWQEPEQLPLPTSLMTTVAYSVKGGYTPTPLRRLAMPFVQDSAVGYQANALDRAAALVRFQAFQQAEPELIELLASEPISSAYLLGTCYHQRAMYSQALEVWSQLLEEPDLPQDGRAYVCGLCAELLCLLERPEEALQKALEAQRLCDPQDYRMHWATAAAYEKMEEYRQATQEIRRGLRLAEPFVFGLQMRLILAQLYRKQGKDGLASIELQKLEKIDTTGQLRPLTLLR